MEHSLQFDLDNPWRTRAFAAAGLAILELIILLSIGTAVFGRSVAHSMQSAAEAKVLAPSLTTKAKTKPKAKAGVKAAVKPAKPAAPPLLARDQTSVLVLNGNGQSGAAANEAAVVRSLTYAIASVGDAPNHHFARTVVMYRPGYRREALRLAKDLHGALVSPLDGVTPSSLMGAHLALVLGSA